MPVDVWMCTLTNQENDEIARIEPRPCAGDENLCGGLDFKVRRSNDHVTWSQEAKMRIKETGDVIATESVEVGRGLTVRGVTNMSGDAISGGTLSAFALEAGLKSDATPGQGEAAVAMSESGVTVLNTAPVVLGKPASTVEVEPLEGAVLHVIDQRQSADENPDHYSDPYYGLIVASENDAGDGPGNKVALATQSNKVVVGDKTIGELSSVSQDSLLCLFSAVHVLAVSR